MSIVSNLVISLIFLVSSSLSGDVFSLDQSIKGEIPSSQAPWANVSIYSVDSNILNIEFNPYHLETDSYVRYWYLNFTDEMNVNQLQFRTIGGNSNTEPSVSTGINSFNVAQGGKFDIRVHFPEASQQRFLGGETVLLEVTAVNPIIPSMFDYGSYTNKPDESYYSALEVWGVGDKNKQAWIGSNSTVAVPEPSTYLILAILLAFVGLAAYLKEQKKESE